MRVRPKLTIEAVLSLHESIERACPPGSGARGYAQERAHQIYLAYAARLKRRRQLLSNNRDLIKLKLLSDMLILDACSTEKLSFRALARTVLGKTDLGSIERLARKYAQLLHGCPGPGRKARIDRLAQEFHDEYVDRINRLAQEFPEIVREVFESEVAAEVIKG